MSTDHIRPMSHPESPETLEARVEAMLESAERAVPEISYPTDARTMRIAQAVAREAGCVLVWPTPRSCAALFPETVYDEAVRLTNAARELRLARVHTNVMQAVAQ